MTETPPWLRGPNVTPAPVAGLTNPTPSHKGAEPVKGAGVRRATPGRGAQQKGKEGERQVAKALNEIIEQLLVKHGIPKPDKPIVQRNQNQTAVGGNDLSNVFGISIEVKRQEMLSVNTWWNQCIAAAERNMEFPVLIYRQNNKAWRVVTYMWIQLPASDGSTAMQVRAEMDWESFLVWFRAWVDRKLSNGELPKV